MVGAAAASGLVDDAARRIGVTPHPEPRDSDVEALRAAARRQRELVTRLADLDAADPGSLTSLVALAREQLAAISDASMSTTSPSPGVPSDRRSLATAFDDAADDAAGQSLSVVSPALSTVLASLALGRIQVSQALQA